MESTLQALETLVKELCKKYDEILGRIIKEEDDLRWCNNQDCEYENTKRAIRNEIIKLKNDLQANNLARREMYQTIKKIKLTWHG